MNWLSISGFVLIGLFLAAWARRTWVQRNHSWPAEDEYEREFGKHDFETNRQIADRLHEARATEKAYTNIIKITFYMGVLLLLISFFF